MSIVSPAAAEAPLVLTIDVGTSAVRALLYDRWGRSVTDAEARAAYEVRTSADGGVDVDAEELLAAVEASVDGVLAQAGPLAERVAGVGTTTFWHNVIGVDGEGKPLTPVLTWADTRASGVAAELRQEWDEAAYHSRTGCPLHPSYLPSKLIWLHRAQPEVFRRVRRWMSFGEFLYFRLFGEAVCSVSMASGSGLLNRNACTWDDDVLGRLPLGYGVFWPIGDLDEPQRGLRAAYAARWPALSQLPWFPAIGDGASSNIGGGCVSPRRITLMVGTSGAMRVVLEARDVSVPFGLWCYRVDRRRMLIGGALSNGGNLIAWLRQMLKLDDATDLEQQVASLQPDAHGLTILPFLAGERSMGWVGQARAAFVGLSLATQPAEIVRAGMEAVGYRFAFIHRALSSVLPPDEGREIIASGNALLHSAAWMQMMADVLGQPVSAVSGLEASSRGTALLVLEALGALRSLEDAPLAVGPTYQPDQERHARYTRAIERQKRLYDLLIPTGASVAGICG